MFNIFKKRTKAQILIQSDIKNIMDNKKLALIMFGAGWCGACKMQKPIINEMAHYHKDSSVIIAMVDTDQEPLVSSMFQISVLPTILAIQHNKVIFKKTGLMSRKVLETLFSELEKSSI